MELRVLEYFLAVAREQSISGAAIALHLSQPTLSRQLKDLEDQLGKQLFIRGNRNITLTDDGILLRKRAEEIIKLVQKTENELLLEDDAIAGDVYIGAGETDGIRYIANITKKLQEKYPMIHYNISSGDAVTVMEDLDKGLIDFAVLLEPADLSNYEFIKLPVCDTWGAIVRFDSPLAKKESVCPKDIWDLPLIVSRQAIKGALLPNWIGKNPDELNIVTTYNLIFNASLFVDEGIGVALCIDKIINTSGDSNLRFIPFEPKMEVGISIAWKKHQVHSKACEKFLIELKNSINKK